ncbi:BREX-1 system adenine-specific DNA-methyltransferase PglX [Nitrosomonas aestuarii]|uniref:BREX-1 system adenine-specific DNA-methyltransferase PglX n=1 Tax=Nitrosomonas aestuarii TaxID=52441 RepID=UPI000D30D7FB|nr:BREX-1 system adenine-specific DNA-methyltransferase PglX [Nitrosomonas aestuarii]PTN11853.1 type II restriction/modification system DNA methylase subunit YeeA [Nitrosomonas aestuarii]
METAKLKKFAQFARRSLLEQVSAKLELVLVESSAARRESVEAIRKLEEAIKNHGKEQVIERVAYIWFNRFCALRFMDVNRHTRIGVVSPAEGQFQPEILMDAKMGHIDEEMVGDKIRQQIFALLDGKAPSRDSQGEAYRLLVVAACNYWHKAMPFLFERIDDYTELLMPDDLLSGNSILAYTREAMTPDVCQDVEVIGWLYQFYISEKKDEVFDGLKKNKKITPENIPAATQLFTPHWIVRYLVENSLGRLWLLNRPQSKLAEQMDYYIKPEQPETDFLRINKPEEIKICDPACGSGHMLTYAFDLLYAIYEEEGYEPAEIPSMILTHNLYGIEIDERAGELAAFALTMKARAKQRRFFTKGVKPNICVLENIQFDEGEIEEYMDFIGRDLFTVPLQTTLSQFEEADNFGSLIRPDVIDVDNMFKILESKNVSGHLFLSLTHQKVLQALRQADYLSPNYHVVIANPPYMGASNANNRLKSWLSSNYQEEKNDLFAAFIDRNLSLSLAKGSVAMITMQNWMFISRYEGFRSKLLSRGTVLSMAHLGERAFDSIGGEVVSTTAFVISMQPNQDFPGIYVRLTEGRSEKEKSELLTNAANNPACGYMFKTRIVDFHKIPGDPLAYWVPNSLRDIFASHPSFDSVLEAREGLTTGKNDDYVRFSFEVSTSKVYRHAADRQEAVESQCKWFSYNKGGEKRKWYGNDDFILYWENDGEMLQTRKHPSGDRIWAHNFNLDFIFRPSISWSDITTKGLSARLFPEGYLFDATGLSAFNRKADDWRPYVAAICNSKVGTFVSTLLNPTLHFKSGDFSEMPLVHMERDLVEKQVGIAIKLSTTDWHFYETSWDFTSLPLLSPDYLQPSLMATYQKLRAHWREMTLEMQRLEQENNRIFIEAYGLQDELTPEVLLNEITLTCNPHYRYGNDKSEEELEALLLADTMRELVSYAVGCMFGRYALDKPGLILANQGETIEDYLERVPEPSFPADGDNAIPMLDGDWFTDDIAERFRKFLRVAFGDEHYEENLRFIEAALGKNGKARGIRDYFLKDFYSDHVKRYKKRPIYWLFSSSKGSFNALIYMHRYRPDTVSVVLNDYLREFRTKLTAHKNHLEAVSISASSSPAEKTKALKEIEKISKMIAEMDEYEREVLYPLATEQVTIDLDDGVKVNYPKFGASLKKIPGLDAKNEE